MIKVHYTGRLGNNMFQYALGRYLAEEMGYELSADPLPFPATHERVVGRVFHEPHEHIGIFEADIAGIVNNPSNRCVILRGIFQLYRYYEPIMDRVTRWFTYPTSLAVSRDINKDDLLIYLRLGDYCHEGIRLNFEYYEATIKMARPRRLFIVAENRSDPFLRLFDPYLPTVISQDPMADLAIARSFKKIVLSASTFSWWAAILSDAEEIYFPIGDEGHWSPINMRTPGYEIDLRVDEKRFIYFYNCAVIKSGLQNTTLIPLAEAKPKTRELRQFHQSALSFHKNSKAYWFASKLPDTSPLNCSTVLNLLIAQHEYTSYLEFSFGDQSNFNAIHIPSGTKIRVDPICAQATHQISSDVFFAINDKTYDIIFINSLRKANQLYKDILSSLKVLNAGGTIVCHDINPITFEGQLIPRQQSIGTGDCWKAWVKLRMERSDLDMKVIDADNGCGLIRAGGQHQLPFIPDLNWGGLVANRKEWLNLISAEEFLEVTNIPR